MKRARAESPALFGGRVGSPAFGGAGSASAAAASAVFGKSSSFTAKSTSGSGVFGGNDLEDSAAEEEDEEQGTSFGDRLRNERGDDDEVEEDSGYKMNLEEQEGMWALEFPFLEFVADHTFSGAF
jgi:hypothetical protein